ncbi:hypothetical protein ACQJBY_071270 [Aegilops geniculata]
MKASAPLQMVHRTADCTSGMPTSSPHHCAPPPVRSCIHIEEDDEYLSLATSPSYPRHRALPLVIHPQLFQFRPPESLAAGNKHLAIVVCFSVGAVV